MSGSSRRWGESAAQGMRGQQDLDAYLGRKTMKVAISMNTPQLDAPIEKRFGRCKAFLIIDRDTLDWQGLANPGAKASGGAGTQAAQFLAGQRVQAVISGAFGPKAHATLKAAGIQTYSAKSDTARSLVEDLRANRLKKASS